MNLRPYQLAAVEATEQALLKDRSTVVFMATGLGKTLVKSELARRTIDRGKRVMAFAHREELIEQLASKIRLVCGVEPEIEMGDRRANESVLLGKAPVVVGSVQTLSRGRMHRFDPSEFGLVLVDEAHHAPARSYRKVIGHFMANPECRLAGFTATPRGDGVSMGIVFDSCAFDYDIIEGRDDGWLVPVEQVGVSVHGIDYSKVRVKVGEFDQKQLDEILASESILHQMVAPYLEIAGDRRGLVFAQNVNIAKAIASVCRRYKPGSAEVVHGNTASGVRRNIFKRFADGQFQHLVNVGIATEGWDDAATDGCGVQCIAMMRPTRSRSVYLQMLGRGTRPLPGIVDGLESAEDRRHVIATSRKPRVTAIDFFGSAGNHSLVTAVDVLGGRYPDEVVARAKRKAEVSGSKDVSALLEEAEQEEREERDRRIREVEEARRKGIRAKVHFTTNLFAGDRKSPNAPKQKKLPRWMYARGPTEAQKKVLRRIGHAETGIDQMRASDASRLIDEYMHGPPSEKAVSYARSLGISADGLTRKELSAAIDFVKGKK